MPTLVCVRWFYKYSMQSCEKKQYSFTTSIAIKRNGGKEQLGAASDYMIICKCKQLYKSRGSERLLIGAFRCVLK